MFKIGITKRNTYHGNPSEKRLLPIATRVMLEAATLPDSKIKWWAYPFSNSPWPKDTAEWAESVGVGLCEEDVVITGDWS